MWKIEAQTTHTVKLSWGCKYALGKGELIRALTDTLPTDAKIVDLSVADVQEKEPDYTTPAVKRTLTITYVTDNRDLRGR